MELYTIESLDADLQTFIRTIANFNLSYSSLFFTQKKIGARIKEMCTASRWNFSNLEDITLQPQKGNLLRHFNLSIFDEYAIYKIRNNEFPFSLTSPEVTRYFFNTYYPRLHVFVGRKEIQSHLFRHLFCKEKFANGESVEDISTELGEIELSNTRGYIYSQLYYL
jgi:hypothetical protein